MEREDRTCPGLLSSLCPPHHLALTEGVQEADGFGIGFWEWLLLVLLRLLLLLLA